MSNMLLFTDHYNYYLYDMPTNMNKSFSGLEGLVKKNLMREMNDKDVYVFLNKQLTHIKIFCYSKRKYTLIYERLHRGTFKIKQGGNKKATIQLSANELLKIIRGIVLGDTEK